MMTPSDLGSARYGRPVAVPGIRAICGLILLVAALAMGTAAQADKATLNLTDADIEALINTVADITGKSFIIDPRVRGEVTVVSKRPMDPDEIYQVFLSVLEVHNYAAVATGEAVKIVPLPVAKRQGGTLVDDRQPGRGDDFVTRVIDVNHVAASQLVPALRPLVPSDAHFAANDEANVLVVADRASNVQRLVDIVSSIDQPVSDDVEVIRLEHAAADEVANVLSGLDHPQREGRPRPSVTPDHRTNSVLIGGPEDARLRLRGLVAHLDTPVETPGNTQVVYLRYANAEDLIPILQEIDLDTRVGEDGRAEGGGTRIQADSHTNALIITAPPDVMPVLNSVVRQLDIRRAQVLVEAIIVEMSADRVDQLGVEWIVDGTRQGTAVGVAQFDGGVSRIVGPLLDNGAPDIRDGATLAAGDFRSDGRVRFAALLRALSEDTASNVLSTPSLMTLDNEEAEIVVAEEVPFVTGRFGTVGDTPIPDSPFQTIQRQDVGLTLRVRPQINEGNAIRLNIEQEVSNLTARSAVAGGEITNRRAIKTNVMVEDGDLIVLGGLLDDQVRETEQKVPGLGDLPFVGGLFRFQSSTTDKRNLMVFLRPQIVRDAATSSRVSHRKYNFMRSQQLLQAEQHDGRWPSHEPATLEPLDASLRLPPRYEAARQQDGGGARGLDLPPPAEVRDGRR